MGVISSPSAFLLFYFLLWPGCGIEAGNKTERNIDTTGRIMTTVRKVSDIMTGVMTWGTMRGAITTTRGENASLLNMTQAFSYQLNT